MVDSDNRFKWSAQQIYDFSTYILALSTYCKGKIDEWDVINLEAIVNNGFREDTWYNIVNTQANSNGEIGYHNYFAYLFKWARMGDPDVELFYNDYNIRRLEPQKIILCGLLLRN